jgi:hypothetical protein
MHPSLALLRLIHAAACCNIKPVQYDQICSMTTCRQHALGCCPVARFSKNLYVDATATNGWTNELDCDAHKQYTPSYLPQRIQTPPTVSCWWEKSLKITTTSTASVFSANERNWILPS